MTTSQASRVYGIPYNSLLMYVRGKYGKSLKLDKLKETTPAAKDDLNTIGNSRSTPKEKMAAESKTKTKNLSGSSQGSNKSAGNGPKTPLLENFENNPFMAYLNDSSRMKEVMQQIQSRQAMLDQSERLKEIEKNLGPEQAKLLMPLFAGNQSGNTEVQAEKENNEEFAEKPSAEVIEDDNKNDIMKPLNANNTGAGEQISAS